jgi:BirA family biotin operon repressor/biotin-[acetyl-CoA-carboxylase] ligase
VSKTTSSLDLLDVDMIKSHLKTRRIGKKVVVYNSTASTNDVAAEYARNKNNDGLVVLAEEQGAGRGRGGNKWVSSHGDSVLCSILLTECAVPSELLSLACAVATAEAIGKCSKAEAKIKWPNDILLNGKKVAGILIESKKTGKHLAFVIGIGINCHQTRQTLPAELRKTATSIDIETGSVTDRISLIKRLITSVEEWLETAELNKNEVIERWRKFSTQLNRRIVIIYNRKRFEGNCIGIDPEKGLILQLDAGGIRMFHVKHSTIAKE